MKSIRTLLRVKQRQVDDLKRQQGVLLNQREEIHVIIDGLSNQLASELVAAQELPDMAHFFGDYSAAIKKRQEMMHAHLRRLEVELDKLTQQLQEYFAEMKKFELLIGRHETRIAQKAARLEQEAMDEVAISGYIRQDEP